MAEVNPPVKRRAYDSPNRRQQAQATRARILASAEKLFLAHGYRSTTCAAIADAAGSSEASVFAVFGSKPRLLVCVVRAVVRGTADEVPLRERPQWRRLSTEEDKERALQTFVDLVSKAHERSWRLLSIVHAAAEEDDELAAAATQARHARRRDCDWFATTILGLDAASPKTKAQVDFLWAQTSVDVYRLLTIELGWTPQKYAAWISKALSHELLGHQGTDLR